MNETILALASITSISGVFILLFWAYRDYRVDSFRQDMFTLRDSLFDQAVEGKITFDAPAYGMLRMTINGFIRFGHRLTLPNSLCIAFALSRSNLPPSNTLFSKRLDSSLRNLDHDQRHLVREYHQRMNFLLVQHLLMSSPLLFLTIVVPLSVYFFTGVMIGKAVKMLRHPMDRLRSPLLLLTIVVSLSVSFFTTGVMVGKAVKALRHPVDRLDMFALAEGEIRP